MDSDGFYIKTNTTCSQANKNDYRDIILKYDLTPINIQTYQTKGFGPNRNQEIWLKVQQL